MQSETAERNSFFKRTGSRLADRNRWPRRWRYPPRFPRQDSPGPPSEEIKAAHKACSETIRRSMLTLLGLALFCLVTTFGANDVDLLKSDPTIEVPFADVKMSFVGFLVVVPLLLIVVSIYLHLFVGHKANLGSQGKGIPPIEQTPTIFNLAHPIAHWLTAFIFYWLVPLVLAVITQVARTRLTWGIALAGVTLCVTAVLVILQIRRCVLKQRVWWNLPRWASLVAVVGLEIWLGADAERFRRPANLYRVDLHDTWLLQADLRDTIMIYANLRGARLQEANLHRANLSRADLQGARLQVANLEEADLEMANLQEAILPRANLKRANLTAANLKAPYLPLANLKEADLKEAFLKNTNLSSTNLKRANLIWVGGLTCPQLHAATDWEKAYRDPDLGCGAPIPTPPSNKETPSSSNQPAKD